MGKWLDIKGPVVADTVYADNTLVAKDVAFTLPGLEFMTADVMAMGNMTVPLVGLLENMELTITKIGVDMGLSRLGRLEKQNLEFRWVQNVVKSDGTQGTEGCKAFVRVMPAALPELGVEIGSATEAEGTYTVTRMQIYANGAEYMCVDRLRHFRRTSGDRPSFDLRFLISRSGSHRRTDDHSRKLREFPVQQLGGNRSPEYGPKLHGLHRGGRSAGA